MDAENKNDSFKTNKCEGGHRNGDHAPPARTGKGRKTHHVTQSETEIDELERCANNHSNLMEMTTKLERLLKLLYRMSRNSETDKI